MQEFEAIVTENGQVTIPVKIRRMMGLRPGDRVRFQVEGNVIRIERASSKLLAGFGAVSPIKRPEDYRKLREGFEKEVAEDVVSEA